MGPLVTHAVTGGDQDQRPWLGEANERVDFEHSWVPRGETSMLWLSNSGSYQGSKEDDITTRCRGQWGGT